MHGDAARRAEVLQTQAPQAVNAALNVAVRRWGQVGKGLRDSRSHLPGARGAAPCPSEVPPGRRGPRVRGGLLCRGDGLGGALGRPECVCRTDGGPSSPAQHRDEGGGRRQGPCAARLPRAACPGSGQLSSDKTLFGRTVIPMGRFPANSEPRQRMYPRVTLSVHPPKLTSLGVSCLAEVSPDEDPVGELWDRHFLRKGRGQT